MGEDLSLQADTHGTYQAAAAKPHSPEQQAEAFAEKMIGWINGGAISLMISLGHRSGLFDTMDGLVPSTSAEIAQAAGLSERYVREWLGAMTTAGIVEHDAAETNETTRFSLPPAHAACLTRSSPENMAVFSQYIGMMGAAEDPVLDAFHHGRGVSYDAYPRFPEVMAEDSGQSAVAALEEHILPLVPGLAERLETGIDVVDVGCGRGMALLKLAGLYPNSRFTGLDLLTQHIGWAQGEADRRGLMNIQFRRHDASKPFGETCFDQAFTFDAVHDQGDPAGLLSNIHKALRPGGWYLCQDIKGSSCIHMNTRHPIGPLLYTVSCMHCMSVSLAQGGPGLGAMWGSELALEMFREAGFPDPVINELGHDIQNNYYVMRRLD